MTTNQLVKELSSLGFKIDCRGGRLVVQGPRHAMSPALEQQIRDHKDGLLALLTSHMSMDEYNSRDVSDESYSSEEQEGEGLGPLVAQQETLTVADDRWLASVDWQQGLVCGITG